MTTVAFTKYHGLGNDFLVLVDWERTGPYDEVVVAALCDRHRGIGADGVLRLSRPGPGADLRMELRNADGGEAETSGNGLRCALLAAAHAGLLPADAFGGSAVHVETKGGPSTGRLLVDESRPGALADVSVAMGEATVDGAGRAPFAGCRTLRVDVGNPHLVLVDDGTATVDLAVVGAELEASRPGGTNVELVRLAGGVIDLVVWERGVGLTLACGSGSCAAAAAARALGLVGDRVAVRNPGGVLTVDLDGPAERPRVILTGPACRVGEVIVDLDELRLAAGAPA